MAFRLANAERRLGLPRAELSTMRHARDAVDTEDEETDDDDDEELEIEHQRQLFSNNDNDNSNAASAASSNNNSNNKTQTEDEIANEYNKQKGGKNNTTKSRRRPPPTLQPEQLVGDKGLMVLRQSFPNRFAANGRLTKKDMPHFARQLVAAYQNWADDLVPGAPLEEIASKLYDQMSSKGMVKSHLQTLRNHVRNHHVERIYGLEKGEYLIQQLEDGMQQAMDAQEVEQEAAAAAEEQQPEGGEEEAPETDQPEGDDSTAPNTAETSTATEDAESSPVPNASLTTVTTTTSRTDSEAPTPCLVTRKRVFDDSSDDEELIFENDDNDNANENHDGPPRPNAAKKRRAVLEDSDSEEDEDKELVLEDAPSPPPSDDSSQENKTIANTSVADVSEEKPTVSEKKEDGSQDDVSGEETMDLDDLPREKITQENDAAVMEVETETTDADAAVDENTKEGDNGVGGKDEQLVPNEMDKDEDDDAKGEVEVHVTLEQQADEKVTSNEKHASTPEDTNIENNDNSNVNNDGECNIVKGTGEDESPLASKDDGDQDDAGLADSVEELQKPKGSEQTEDGTIAQSDSISRDEDPASKTNENKSIIADS